MVDHTAHRTAIRGIPLPYVVSGWQGSDIMPRGTPPLPRNSNYVKVGAVLPFGPSPPITV